MLNGTIRANAFEATAVSNTGTVAVSLNGTTGGTIILGEDNSPFDDDTPSFIGAAQGSTQTFGGGIAFTTGTSTTFVLGDGEEGTDTDSSIAAQTVFDGTLPNNGMYNFLDVGTFTGSTALIPSGIQPFFVNEGASTGVGSLANPGNITDANAANAQVIALIDKTVNNTSDDIIISAIGGIPSLTLDEGQILVSLARGESIDLSEFGLVSGPTNFSFASNSGLTGSSVSIDAAETSVDTVRPTLSATSTGAVVMGGGAIIGANIFSDTGVGINVNQGSSSGNIILRDLTVEAPGSIGINISIPGARSVELDTVTATGIAGTGAVDAAIRIAGAGLTVTELNDITILGGGHGLLVETGVTFDADPNLAGFQPVQTGTFTYGTSTNRLTGGAIEMDGVTGALNFNDISVFNQNVDAFDIVNPTAGSFLLGFTGGTIDTLNRRALNLQQIITSGTLNTVRAAGSSSQPIEGAIFAGVSGSLGIDAMTVNFTSNSGDGLRASLSSLDLTIGQLDVAGLGRGLELSGFSGDFTATTVNLSGQSLEAMRLTNTLGMIDIDTLNITITDDNARGIRVIGRTTLDARDVSILASSDVGTIAVDLSAAATAPQPSIVLGDPNAGGANAIIGGTGGVTGPAIGFNFGSSPDVALTFGDGGDINADGDEGSSITATTVFGGTLPTNGTYNFDDVGTLVGDTSLLSSVDVFYADQAVTAGAGDGSSVAQAGALLDPNALLADVIVLVDTDNAGAGAGVDSIIAIGNNILQLPDNQILLSIANGDAPIDLSPFGLSDALPSNFTFGTTAGISPGNIIDLSPAEAALVDTVRPTIFGTNNVGTIGLNGTGTILNTTVRNTIGGDAIGSAGGTGTLTLQTVTVSSPGNGVHFAPGSGNQVVRIDSLTVDQSTGVGLRLANPTITVAALDNLDLTPSGVGIFSRPGVIYDADPGTSALDPVQITGLTYGTSTTNRGNGSGVSFANNSGTVELVDPQIFVQSGTVLRVGAQAIHSTPGNFDLLFDGGTIDALSNGFFATFALDLKDVDVGGTLDTVNVSAVTGGSAPNNAILFNNVGNPPTTTFTINSATLSDQVQTTTNTGILFLDSDIDVSINDLTVEGFSTGIRSLRSGGNITFTGQTTITNPGESGIRIEGTAPGGVAVFSFNDLDIALQRDNSTGLDLADAQFAAGNVSLFVDDFDLTSTSNTGTVGVDLRNASGNGIVRLGAGNMTGGSSIAGVATAIDQSAITALNFTFGDGGDIPVDGDEASSLQATNIFGGSTPVGGNYNFLDVGTITGNTSNLSGSAPSVFFVDQNQNPGGNGQSVAQAGSIANAAAASVDVIALIDTISNGSGSSINLANTLNLDDGQVLVSLSSSTPVVDLTEFLGGSAPANFQFPAGASVGGTILTAPAGIDSTIPFLQSNGFTAVSFDGGGTILGSSISADNVPNGPAVEARSLSSSGDIFLHNSGFFSRGGLSEEGLDISPTMDINLSVSNINVEGGPGAASEFNIGGNTGTVTVTRFDDVNVTNFFNQGQGTGLQVGGGTIFDADPGTAGFQTVSARNFTQGAFGAHHSGSGIFLPGAVGSVEFENIIIFSQGRSFEAFTGNLDVTFTGGTLDTLGPNGALVLTNVDVAGNLGIVRNEGSANSFFGAILNNTGSDLFTIGTLDVESNFVNVFSGLSVGGTGNITINDATIRGYANGVNVGNFTGDLNIVGGAIGNASPFVFNGFNSNNSSGTVTIGADIRNTSNASGTANIVRITGDQGGSYTFSGTLIDAGGGDGILLESANAATDVTFNGSVQVNVVGNTTAFTAQGVGGGTGAGTVTFADAPFMSLVTASGGALFNDGWTLNGEIDTLAVTSLGPDNAVNFLNSSGTLDILGGSINAAGIGGGDVIRIGSSTDLSGGSMVLNAGFNIANTSTAATFNIQELTGGSLTFSGNFTDGTSNTGGQILVSGINNGTPATVTFSGATKEIDTTLNNAIDLSDNPDGTINFTGGGLDISTVNGIGFRAGTFVTPSNQGVVSVQDGRNKILVSGTGQAVVIENMTIGAQDVTFESVDRANAVNAGGISLVNTGTTGRFRIIGDGDADLADNSGGTIRSTGGTPFAAIGTVSFDLNEMLVENSGGSGIAVSATLDNLGQPAVSDFTIASSTVIGGVRALDFNVGNDAQFDGEIRNTTATATANVASPVNLFSASTQRVTLEISDSTFTDNGNPTSMAFTPISASNNGAAGSLCLDVQNNTFTSVLGSPPVATAAQGLINLHESGNSLLFQRTGTVNTVAAGSC
ncbi:MAG: hypothetical protein AAGJ28_04055 [Pseudomonadota bacterium]